MSPDYILRILNVSLTPSLFREICTPFLSLNTCARMYTHPCIHIHLAVSYSSSKTQLKCHLPDSSLLANCSLFCVPSETCTCISIKKKNSWDLWRLCLHHLHPLSTENSSHFGSLFSCFLFPFLPSFLPSSCNCSVGAQPRPKGSSLTPLPCAHPESNLSGNPLSSTTKAPPQELILSLQHRANSLGQADVVFLAWLLQPSWASLLLTCLAAVN